ncbi:MAG: 5'-nucleotidase C-terminal domain-containing protein [Sandaracinaceae bacterium]|nr:5'-nucleotidase C-terminal domain-containing protein [Sandaracinaceae bacterium]
MEGRLVVTLATLATLALGVQNAHAQRDVRMRVIATSDVDGHLGIPVCDDTRDVVPHPRGLYTYALVRQASAPDRPLVVDAGGLLGQGGVVRFAAEHDVNGLAELVLSLGYDGLAFGASEIATPRTRMIPLAEALGSRGVPFISSNLRCRGPRTRPLCDAIVDASDPPTIVHAGELDVALLAMTEPEALAHLEPELTTGLSLEPIDERLAAIVRDVRDRVGLVVLLLDADQDDALDLLESIAPEARPDLVILSDPQARLLFSRPTGVTPAIVTPPPSDAVEVVIREDREVRVGIYQMIAQPLAQRGLSVGEPVLRFLERIGPSYCDVWGQSLPGGRLERAIDRAGLTELVAELLRESVEADVAVLNPSLFDATFQPAHEDELTASDLYVALEHDELLYRADVPREWLVELAGHRATRSLATPGLTGTGGETRVRSRALVSRASYRVVTTRYLARGGQSALPELPSGLEWSPVRLSELRRWRTSDDDGLDLDPTLSVREIALRALSVRDGHDPRDARPSPSEAPEWVIQGFVDGSFSGSSVDNPAGYQAAQLNRSSTIALGTEVNLRADATAPSWTWENLGIFRYRTQWTEGGTTMGVRAPGAFTEAVDQIQLRSTGSYRGLRAQPSASEPYLPDPYAEIFVETELTQPASRMFHWLLFRPTLGARFPLTTDLELKLQTGLEAQLLQSNNEAVVGVGAVLTLRPWDLLRMGERHVQIQGLVDFFYSDPGDTNRWQLRGSFDASLDLAGPLALTFGVRAFLQQEHGGDLGFALDATAGFRIGTLTRVVGP